MTITNTICKEACVILSSPGFHNYESFKHNYPSFKQVERVDDALKQTSDIKHIRQLEALKEMN